MDKSALEPALNSYVFGLGDELTAFAWAAGVDESAPAAVLNDEFVAEDLGDLTLHRDLAPVMHGRDWGGRQHHQRRATGLQGRGRDTAADSEGNQKGGEERWRSLSGAKGPEPRWRGPVAAGCWWASQE
jgi:hypothetical protein